MILPGCTRGHIRARYVLQGYLIRNLMFGQRWAFLLAIGGPFFFFLGPSVGLFFFFAIGGLSFFPSVGFFFHLAHCSNFLESSKDLESSKEKAAELYQMRL